MPKVSVVKGTTSYLARIFLQDSSSTTGAGLTGLTSASAGLVCSRSRDDDGNAAATAITLSAGTRGTWSSGGFVEKDSSQQPGVYEFGVPNAALATGSKSVLIYFKGATNLAPLPLEIELTGWDNQDAVHGGMTALPNAVAGASGGVLISGSNAGTTTFGALTVTGSMTVSDGLLVSRSSANASAITATGNGTGSGIVATSGAGATGDGVQMTAASTNGSGLRTAGSGSANGFTAVGGATGDGANFTGGATSGAGLRNSATSGDGFVTSGGTNGNGWSATGVGTGHGAKFTGGGTGSASSMFMTGGNAGLNIQPTNGDAIVATGGAGNGNGLSVAGNGTAHGLKATGGATSGDGIHATLGGTGVDIRGNQTGNLVGTVSTLTTYTGNTVQTGDAFARLGAPAGASVSADVAAIKSDTGTILTDVNTGAGAIYSRLGAPTGASMSADIAAVNAKTTNLPASPAAVGSAMTLTTGERTSVADALLDRDMSVGTDSGSTTVRTVRQALRLSRNKWGISGGTITVTKEDDATTSWTGAVTTTAGNPVSQIDPA